MTGKSTMLEPGIHSADITIAAATYVASSTMTPGACALSRIGYGGTKVTLVIQITKPLLRPKA